MGKGPLEIKWDDILSTKDNEESTLEVEIASTNLDVSHLSDHQIQERIQKHRRTLGSSLPVKLPDKGAKLRISIQQLEAELRRRKLERYKKDAEENERAKKSETPESPGMCNDLSPHTAPKSEQCSFTSVFSKTLKERADPAHNGRLTSFGRDNCKNPRKNGRWPYETKTSMNLSSQQIKMSSRSSPFQCASNLVVRDNYCRITEPSPVGRISDKRKACESDPSLNLRSRKAEDVVLLDEDEEATDDCREARVYYPSRDDRECVELSYSDIKCLNPEEYLTSSIMNFYIRYLQKPMSPNGLPRGEYHFFNTYFFKKLDEAVSCKDDWSAHFLKLRRWWKGIDIFQKAYIFLPIHRDMHWSLVIICIPPKEDDSGPIVLHLDSLAMHHSEKIFDIVYRFLEEEWNYIKKNSESPDLPISDIIWADLPSWIVKGKLKVPQQKNDYDCGLFVLYFMERFIHEAPERLKKKDLNMFGSKWFLPEEASGLRKRIRDLLAEEFENARLESGREESPAPSGSSSDDDVQQLIEL